MVLANSIYIGLDTHVRAVTKGDGNTALAASGLAFEFSFFCVFFIELLLRIAADRCPAFFYTNWNLIDLLLVVTSGLDVLFALASVEGGSLSQDLGKLRALRLLKITRVARMVRLVRVFRFRKILRAMRGLILLVLSILRALRSMGWVALIMGVSTYLIAIVTTEFLGMGNEDDDADIEEWFGDMLKSMFTLIQLSTLADWDNVARHVGVKSGFFWQWFFVVYVLVTNLIVLNVVLATLVESVVHLNEEVKEARNNPTEEHESWMKTPSDFDNDGGDVMDEAAAAQARLAAAVQASPGVGGKNAALQQSAADRIAMQTLSDFYDHAAVEVGVEGVSMRRVATLKGIAISLRNAETHMKLAQVCPPLAHLDPVETAQKIWSACPKRLDQEGLNRQELAEAVLTLRGELSMNHFVVISKALTNLEKHIDVELVHLNKHQRKMNRRFLKLRHRLRKVYHFDGAPRKMMDLIAELKRKRVEANLEAARQGGFPAHGKSRDSHGSKDRPGGRSDSEHGRSRSDDSEASLSDDSSGDSII